MMKRRIALAFSGGGCHIIHWSKVVKILQEKNYRIDAVSGVSSGCFMAIPIAAGYTAEEVSQLLRKYYPTFNKLHFQPKWHRGYGVCTNVNIGDVIEKVCAEKGIYQMKDFSFPIIIRAVDAEIGEPVYFTNLDIPGERTIKTASPKEAVMASCAFPGLYKGVEVKDDEGKVVLCTDGGARGNCVVKLLKKVFQENLEVYACIYKNKERKKAKHFLGIVKKLCFLAMSYITKEELKEADRVLEMKRSNTKVLDRKCQWFDTMEKEGKKQIQKMFP